MKIENVDISSLLPYKLNAKKHPESQIEGIAESIKRFGFTQPIVIDKNNVVIIGHGRLEAAKKIGLDTAPVLRIENLNETEIKALRLIDNRIAETEWDIELLNLDLEDLSFDFSPFNIDFDDLTIDEIVSEAVDDEVDEPSENQVDIKEGDLFILGNHRLVCGSCLDQHILDKLFDNNKADMIFTDPPYNIDYIPEERPIGGRALSKNKLGGIQNDKMSDEDFNQFIRDAFASCISVSQQGAAIYVCHPDTLGHIFRERFLEYYKLSSVIIWAKNNFSIGRSDYHWKHEPILYGWPKDQTHKWHGDRSQTTVWEVDREDVSTYSHPTQKPVELPCRALKNSSKKGQIVFDPFGGSGSTLIAAEKMNRKAYLTEIDPKYCDVIVKRWEKITGKKAEKISD